MKNRFEETVENQKRYFNTGQSKELSFRKSKLEKLHSLIKNNEALLYEAIYKDFKKSAYDTYLTELGIIYHEIKLAIKRLPKWSGRQKKNTGLINFPGRSYLVPEPLGTCLVIGAWNYPYQLSILPAVSAMAAGNSVIIKPSELARNTSGIMAKIINSNFDPGLLHIIEGGVEETTALLKNKFDKIFYTGSSAVGKIIMKAASEHLTPVVLELGGKSPAIIMEDANIRMAAKRIVYGKFINAGQTCVAPDYVLIKKETKERFIEEVKKQIIEVHGNNPIASEAFARIINQKHFNRLTKLIDDPKVVAGGKYVEKEKFIAPTLLDNVGWDDAVMQQEIFGPILPIVEFDDLDDAINKVKERDKPLALYIFSRNTKDINKICKGISFGGGMVNDTLLHLANADLPFGGVGYSGMGNYHGKFGFDTFSHHKSLIYKTNLFEPFIKFPPYTKMKFKIAKYLMG